MDLNLLTVASTRAAVEQRSVTASTLVEDFYKKIAAEDGDIHAYLTLSKERAQAKATEIDALADKGAPLPPLAGVPLAIKEVMVTRELRSTAGSKILGNYSPPYDCTAVARLEEAGAIVLGKTNCDEFAMGSSNENSAWGPGRNPRDTSRVPGGSSGGSAAAVAAGTAVAALGSDTGGFLPPPAGVFGGGGGAPPFFPRVGPWVVLFFFFPPSHLAPGQNSEEISPVVLPHS